MKSTLAILIASCILFLSAIAGINRPFLPQHTPSNPPFTPEELCGKIAPSRHPDFVKIKTEHASRDGMYLRHEAYEAFIKMHEAARKDGIKLLIISATRTFDQQKNIWERKWTGKTLVRDTNLAIAFPDPVERIQRVLLFSSMPGTSRHHWGTDIDLNSVQDSYFLKGYGKKVYDWLCLHASKYGFCQPYTPFDKLRPGGFQEEKWHWSYLPLASQMHLHYLNNINYKDISGFSAGNLAERLRIIPVFVNGINPECLDSLLITTLNKKK